MPKAKGKNRSVSGALTTLETSIARRWGSQEQQSQAMPANAYLPCKHCSAHRYLNKLYASLRSISRHTAFSAEHPIRMMLYLFLCVFTPTVFCHNHYDDQQVFRFHALQQLEPYSSDQKVQRGPMMKPFKPMIRSYGQEYEQPSHLHLPDGQQHQPMSQKLQPRNRTYQQPEVQNLAAQWSTTATVTPHDEAGRFDDTQLKDCTAPKIRGDFCSASSQRQMYYYDFASKVCQPFMYNGCNGSGNRFETITECEHVCIYTNGANQMHRDDTVSLREAMRAACGGEYAIDHLTPQQCSNSGQQCSIGHQCSHGFCCPNPDYLCKLRYDSGKFAVGGVKSDRYFYTAQYKTCMRFSFYGSLGNENNFFDYNSCMRTCAPQR